MGRTGAVIRSSWRAAARTLEHVTIQRMDHVGIVVTSGLEGILIELAERIG